MLAVLAIVILCDRVLSNRWLQVFVVILVVSLFATWTYQRNLVWQDEVTLRRDAVAKSPAKPRALAILANALERQHVYDEAAYYYNETLSLNPKNADEIHFFFPRKENRLLSHVLIANHLCYLLIELP